MQKTDIGVAANQQAGSQFATIVRESVLPKNRRHNILWGFCKLCGQSTEYAVASLKVGIFRRKSDGAVTEVPRTDAMRAEAQSIADDLVAQYEEAMAGEHGPFAVGEMRFAFCDIPEMRGDFSVESFRDQVERRSFIGVWARHGDMHSNPQLPGTPSGRQRPSKLYCDSHYPGRSVAARRAYQRDRKFLTEYEVLISVIWCVFAGDLRQWHLDDHALVRDAAYHVMRLTKAPTRMLDENPNSKAIKKIQSSERTIEDYYPRARAAYHVLRKMKGSMGWLDDFRKDGVTNQSEIARRLRVSRQAVSAALKRRKSDRTPTIDQKVSPS